MLNSLDSRLAHILSPEAIWLQTVIDVGSGEATMAIYAPPTTLQVRNLAWPADLGAHLPNEIDPIEVAHQIDAENICADNSGCWIGGGTHYVRVPANTELLEKLAKTAANDQSPTRARRQWAGEAGTTEAYLSVRVSPRHRHKSQSKNTSA